MAQSPKTRAELLSQYPDNLLKLINAEKLRDFVVSIGIYGSQRWTGVAGSQTLGTTDALINFNTNGKQVETSLNGFSEIEILHDGDYEVNVSITADVVPIPAAVWLFASALLGLGGLRRKQQMLKS